MDPLAVARIIRTHQGDIESRLTVDEGAAKVRWVLYDAVVCSAARDDYGSGKSWGLAIVLPGGVGLGRVLGTRLTLLGDETQLIRGLDALREYAELVLPTAYQEAYKKTR